MGQVILGGLLIVVGFFAIMALCELIAAAFVKHREKRLRKLHGKPKRKIK